MNFSVFFFFFCERLNCFQFVNTDELGWWTHKNSSLLLFLFLLLSFLSNSIFTEQQHMWPIQSPYYIDDAFIWLIIKPTHFTITQDRCSSDSSHYFSSSIMFSPSFSFFFQLFRLLHSSLSSRSLGGWQTHQIHTRRSDVFPFHIWTWNCYEFMNIHHSEMIFFFCFAPFTSSLLLYLHRRHLIFSISFSIFFIDHLKRTTRNIHFSKLWLFSSWLLYI